MSAPAPSGGGPPPEDKNAGMGRYVKRLKTVLRRAGSTRQSQPRSESAAAASTEKEPTKQDEPQPSAAQPSSSKPDVVAVTSVPGSRTVIRNAAQQERARALFAKYGLTLESHEWLTTGVTTANVQRVEKPIRMRVHRTCHRCQTNFGTDRTCVNCQHRRCQKCPRYPAKKDKTKDKSEAKQTAEASKTVAKNPKLTLTTRDGRERTRTPIKQRVRRTCHHCDCLFNPPTSTECDNCHHVRCVKCPRDPAKSKKYPNGYPGDAPASEDEAPLKRKRPERTWKKPRQRVRWTCEDCQSLFKEGTRICQCGHERGVEGCKCTREPPKKVKKDPDPEVVKNLEAKLASFRVGDSSTVPTAA